MKLVGTFFLTVVLASPLLQAKEAPVVDEALIAKIVERENQVARSLEKFHCRNLYRGTEAQEPGARALV